MRSAERERRRFDFALILAFSFFAYPATFAASPAAPPGEPSAAATAFDFNPVNVEIPETPPSPIPGQPMAGMPMAGGQNPLTSPATQGFVRVFSDPRMIQAVEKLTKNPNRWKLVYADVVWLIAIIIFRAWRGSLAQSWGAKLWVKTYSLLIFWGVGGLLLPAMVLGDSYMQALRLAVAALFGKGPHG